MVWEAGTPDGTIDYSTVGPRNVNKTSDRYAMNTTELREPPRTARPAATVDDVAAAEAGSLDALRARPFEDLGFARVDHHRAIRQGFPEVILGLGKTPAQIAAIAARIVGARPRCSSRAPTQRPTRRCARVVPGAVYHADAGHHRPAAAGRHAAATGRFSSRRPARRTCRSPRRPRVTAELMGNDVERLYDVGVAGLHRLLGEHARLAAARVIIVVAGMEGALPSVVGGPGQRAGHRGADEHRLRRELRRHRRAARHAQQLRHRRVGGEHRQRLRRRLDRVADQSLVATRRAERRTFWAAAWTS